jgi:hypothetical protein
VHAHRDTEQPTAPNFLSNSDADEAYLKADRTRSRKVPEFMKCDNDWQRHDCGNRQVEHIR